MKYVYAIREESEFQQYQLFTLKHDGRLHAYLNFLETTCQVSGLPRSIVLTSEEVGTKLISSIPLPAYTNDYRTVFCPIVRTWRDIYLRQLEEEENEEIRRYYETGLTDNHVLQILGHEFVHHSDLFIDEAYEQARWFEEGMCEYISRRYFLTDAEFEEEARINALLVGRFEARHGMQALEDFRTETYAGSYAGIFFFYWKSFLAVREIAERYHGDILAVFREYRNWYETAPSLPLSRWFEI